MAARKRREDETFEQYRASLAYWEVETKLQLTPKMFWPAAMGTYIRPENRERVAKRMGL